MNFSAAEWTAALPAMVPALAAVVILLIDLLPRMSKNWVLFISLLGLAVAAFMAVPFWGNPQSNVLGGMISTDGYAVFFELLFLLVAGLSLLLSWGELTPGYAALILWATSGMALLASASNLMTIFLGMELLSLSLYVLVGFSRRGDGEAALKYILLGALATGFLLYGMALVYGTTGTTSLAEIGLRIYHGALYNPQLLVLGAGLVLAGLTFKLALVPFQNWLPDVYQGAPAPVTAFMSVGTKAAAFAVLLRFVFMAIPALAAAWVPALTVLAVFSMFLGNILALKQTNAVRLLAYSGIAHAGYLMAALVSFSVLAASSSLFYLAAYAFTNLGAFAGVLLLGGREGNYELTTWDGLYRRKPLLAAVLSVFLLSLAGIPPTVGFFAKFYILQGVLLSGKIPLAVLLVIASGISLYVYLRVVMRLFSGEAEGKVTVSPPVWTVLAVSLIGTIGLGLFPAQLISIVQHSALSLLP